MRILLFLSFSFYSIVSVRAQQIDSTALKYAAEIKSTTLEKHLKILASDEFEGRETGKKGQKKAMNYLIDEFKSYAIDDKLKVDYKQAFSLIEQEQKNVLLAFGSDTIEFLKDFVIKPSFVKNRIVDGKIKLFKWNEEEGKDVWKGKHVFIKESDTASSGAESIGRQMKLAEQCGVSTIFYKDQKLNDKIKKYEHYYRKNKTRLQSDLSSLNTLKISLTNESFGILLDNAGIKAKKVEKKGRKALESMEVDFLLKIDKPNHELQGENVIAYIPGSDKKKEVVVITAHYDHLGKRDSLIFNGADDDGSGTVALLEIAESFALAKKEGNGPKRSILIMPVSGEEKGLLGSRYYSENPLLPLEQTVVNLNVDMIGRYDEHHLEDSNYIYLIGSDKLSQDLHQLSENVNDTYFDFDLDYRFNAEDDPNRFYYRSDHYNFAKNQIPVIFYFSGVHEDYHKSTDTVDKVDFEKTEKVARLIFLTAWEIANREERIKVDEGKVN